MATVYIPSLLQSLTGGQHKLQVHGSTVRQIIDNLDKSFPGIKQRLVEDGEIRPNISVAVDGELTPLGILEVVAEEGEVHFVPSIAGG